MSESTTDRVLAEAPALPEGARLLLAERLLDSVHGPMPEDVETAWSQEIARRVREIDEGRVEMIPGPQVMNELRAMTHGRGE